MSESTPVFRNGEEIVSATEPSRRGVVVDAHVLLSGPNKGKIEVMWVGGRWTVSEVPSELKKAQPAPGAPSLADMRQAIHKGLAPNWMVLFDALGGTQIAYDALLDDVAASVLETMNGGDHAELQR